MPDETPGLLAIRGYRGRDPACADWPEDHAGSVWHRHGLGHLQFDLEDGLMVIVPADVLARFVRTYHHLGVEAITREWRVIPLKAPHENREAAGAGQGADRPGEEER